jgi:hypothetical protein
MIPVNGKEKVDPAGTGEKRGSSLDQYPTESVTVTGLRLRREGVSDLGIDCLEGGWKTEFLI